MGGSLEPDALSLQRLGGGEVTNGAPWSNQSSLTSALSSNAFSWVGASDYYRFPHLLHFSSAAGLVKSLGESDLTSIAEAMRKTSAQLRSEALGFYRAILGSLLDAPVWETLDERGTCWTGFLAQEDFSRGDADRCRQLCAETQRCVVAAFNG